MANYIVAVEKVVQPKLGNHNHYNHHHRRIRFDIICNTSAQDANNNLKEVCSRNLASFELSEQDVQSIRVAPLLAETFNIQFTKCSGSLKPSKSASVQFIHRRAGKFLDSNENFMPIVLHPISNLVPEGKLTKLSTFHVANKKETSRMDGIIDTAEVSNSMDSLVITEADFKDFTKFTFIFKPVLEGRPEASIEAESQTSIEEETDLESKADSTKNENEVQVEEEEGNRGQGSTEELVENQENVRQDGPSPIHEPCASIPFSTVFDDTIELTIELKNGAVLPDSKRPFVFETDSENNGLIGDFTFPDLTDTEFSSIENNSQDGNGTSKVQTPSPNRKVVPKPEVTDDTEPDSPNSSRLSTLRNFVKCMVIQRLQSMGVQQLDCNDILDVWEAGQLRTNWYFSWPDEEGRDSRVIRTANLISPYVSRPNSSLFRLTPSGHISRSIFSTFVHQVDSLKGIMNNATCTLVQTSVHLLLPEIKLLCAGQLETNSNPIFIQYWIRVITLAAKELKPASPDHVATMVNRELKVLKKLGSKLHKATRKICLQIGKLSSYSETVFRKTLIRLHPKSIQWVSAFDRALKKCYAPDVIHYDPSKLHNIQLTSEDLLKDHVFLSETAGGELLVKNDIEGFWDKFLDLEFSERRLIFLGLTEDLQSVLRRSLNEVKHLQEIYTEGYPGSIKKLLKDVVEELKITSKREDLTLLIKTSIVTHINYLHETLTRLYCIAEEIDGITKNFSNSLQATSFNPKQLKQQMKKRNQLISGRSTVTTAAMIGLGLKGYHTECSTGIRNSRPLLAIPLSHCEDIFKTTNT